MPDTSISIADLLRHRQSVRSHVGFGLRLKVLEAIAAGERLPVVAALLCDCMEGLLPGVACTLLAVDDERRLRPIAGPSMPPAFSAAIEGVAIGPHVGSCGAAAYHGRDVVTRDLQTDPDWQDYNAIPLAAGLRACWSSPVLGPDGRVVGTFALYFGTRRGPRRRERRVVQIGVRLCALAMEHEAVLQRLEQTNGRLDATLTNVRQGLCFFDRNGRLILANGRYMEVYDLPPNSIRQGTSLAEIVELRVAVGSGPAMSGADYLEWRGAVQGLREPTDTVVELENGKWIAIHHRPMPGGGWVATHEDVTERRAAEARIHYLANHDALTGLANRSMFRGRLEQALSDPATGGRCALICIDLDRFKAVNDTHGHPVGDAVLVTAAERLQAAAGAGDTVSRLGGDEFAVLLTSAAGVARAAEAAQRLLQALNQPYVAAGSRLVVTATLGIAVAPGDGDSSSLLLKHADIALYRAKKEGRGTVRSFEADMAGGLQVRLQQEAELSRALPMQEFALVYQPQMDLQSRSIVGFEALIRWHHPRLGLLAPGSFIALAEETEAIVAIGAWVLETACAAAAGWPERVSVAVNLSAVQFRSSAILGVIDAALVRSGLDPQRLEIEITETVLLHETQAVLDLLHEVRARGVRIALDDFGTGQSSLSHVQAFPFDKIKIDRSFVQNMTHRRESRAVVRAVAGLARSLEVRATAEGVETVEQLRTVEQEGCTEVQGYLFGLPVGPGDVPGVLRQAAEGTAAWPVD